MQLDPFMPSWCVEEHGVILCTMSAFGAAIAALQRLIHTPPRSRAYLAASQIGEGRTADAKITVERLRAKAPLMTADRILASEFYSSHSEKNVLRQRLAIAGFLDDRSKRPG